LIKSPDYEPDSEVLHKYWQDIDVRLNGTNLTFTVESTPHSEDDFIQLGGNLIFVGALVSEAGEIDDWGLTRIEVVSQGPFGDEVILYVADRQDLAQLVKGDIGIYDIMQFNLGKGSLREPYPTRPGRSPDQELVKPPTKTPRIPPSCISWTEAGGHVGETTCVWGIVTSTYKSDKAFFINFSETDYSVFNGVSFEYAWNNLDGKCTILRGPIETYKGRPQIILRDPDQVEFCVSATAPSATPTKSPSTAPAEFDIPPGKALFVFYNYTGTDWNIDIGPYFLQVPAKQPGQEYFLGTIAIDPGTYTWYAQSPGGQYFMTDDKGNKAFEFTIVAGEVYEEGVR
jgi:hypothetical protein